MKPEEIHIVGESGRGGQWWEKLAEQLCKNEVLTFFWFSYLLKKMNKNNKNTMKHCLFSFSCMFQSLLRCSWSHVSGQEALINLWLFLKASYVKMLLGIFL